MDQGLIESMGNNTHQNGTIIDLDGNHSMTSNETLMENETSTNNGTTNETTGQQQSGAARRISYFWIFTLASLLYFV